MMREGLLLILSALCFHLPEAHRALLQADFHRGYELDKKDKVRRRAKPGNDHDGHSSSLLGAYVNASAALRQILALGTNPSGSSAPLTQEGYEAVSDRCCQQEMREFIGRVVFDESFEVCDVGGLAGLAPYHSCEKQRTFDDLKGDVYKDLRKTCSWLTDLGQCQPPPPSCPSYANLPAPPDCGCSVSKAVQLDFANAVMTENNLGGLGPTNGAQEMRFGNIATVNGKSIDLAITTLSGYSSAGVNFNGNLYPGFGTIALTNGHSSELRFSFVETGTDTLVTLPEVHFTVFDLDGVLQGGGNSERVAVRDYKGYITDTDPSVIATRMPDKRTWFMSQVQTTNPTDPMQATLEQRQNAVMFFFKDRSTFDLSFAIEPLIPPTSPTSNDVRLLQFAGSSFLQDRCGP